MTNIGREVFSKIVKDERKQRNDTSSAANIILCETSLSLIRTVHVAYMEAFYGSYL